MVKRIKARYAIPDQIDPPGRVCFQVLVPDDPDHIAAFKGQIYDLAWSTNWARDQDNSASLLARVWQAVFDGLERCEVSPIVVTVGVDVGDDMGVLRQNGCRLEFSANGVDWCTLADFTDCVGSAVSQPSPGGTLGSGECVEYDVVLRANEQWRLPVPVDDGFLLEISSVGGAWTDGSGSWFCPDGADFLLGACVSHCGHAGGDPVPGACHASIVAIPDGADGFGFQTQPFQIPDGTGQLDVSFQMNDASLSDNSGSIHFHLKVCGATPAQSFTHTFDFSNGAQGWFALAHAGFTCSLINGRVESADEGAPGPTCTDGDHFTLNQWKRAMPASRFLTTIRVKGETESNNTDAGGVRRLDTDGNQYSLGIDSVSGAYDVTISINDTIDTDILAIVNTNCRQPYKKTFIDLIVVSGLGSDPF